MTERRMPQHKRLTPAEDARVLGLYDRARSLVPDLTTLDGQTRLLASRVLVNASIGQAQLTENPTEAEVHLEQASSLIISEYGLPRKKIATIRTGIDGSTRDTRSELLSDEANYLLTLFALTGRPVNLTIALSRMNTIIKDTVDPALQAATIFDKQQLHYTRGEAAYADVYDAFTGIAPHAFLRDRAELVALRASRFMLLAQDRRDFARAEEGVTVFGQAVARDSRLKHVFGRELLAQKNMQGWRNHKNG